LLNGYIKIYILYLKNIMYYNFKWDFIENLIQLITI
jgi:hypothetical protein